ncbi:MAG: response regulator transcription factor [Gammaproteobacteria bacterium]|nr:response regulator transcription factor [Gammaproteobacteria bacterium]
MRALLVEDDVQLRTTLAARLREAGFAVDEAADGREGEYLGLEFPMDVAIVDLGLPLKPGLEIIRAWRKAGREFPILILTARDRWQEKVEGLQSGADDYLTKPFQFEELHARVQALVRRSAGWSQAVMRSGDIELDTRSQQVTVAGQPLELTAFEYRVLEQLLVHAGEVVSKSELTEKLYEQDFERDSNVIEVLVGRLRKKLDPDGTRQPVETLRGRGYRMARD